MGAVWTFIWALTGWLSQGSGLPVGEIGLQHPGLTAGENTVAELSPNELSMKRALALLWSMESVLEQEAKDVQLETDEVEVEASVGHLNLVHRLTTLEVLKIENEYNDGKANHSMSPADDRKVSGNGTESSKGLAASGNKAVGSDDSMASGNGTDSGEGHTASHNGPDGSNGTASGNKTASSNSCMGSGNGTEGNNCMVSGNGTDNSDALMVSGIGTVEGNRTNDRDGLISRMVRGNRTDRGDGTASSSGNGTAGSDDCMVSSDDSMDGGNGYARGNGTDGNDGHMVSSNRTSIGNWTEDGDGKVSGDGHMIRGNGTHGGNGTDGSNDFMVSNNGTDSSGINGSGHMASGNGTATGNGTAVHDATEGPPEVPIRNSKPPLSHAWPHSGPIKK